jgi:adenylate kinase
VIIVMLGPPGGGKGTQAVVLAEALGLPHVSTGELLRRSLRDRTPLGLRAEGYMKRGELVPDEIVVGMVRERLGEEDASGGVVLDGFPRTVSQAEVLDEVLLNLSVGPPAAVLLDVPRESLMRRLTGRRVCRAAGHTFHVEFVPPRHDGVCDKDGSELYQRADDTPETVANRLDVYERDTAPVIDYYRASGRLTRVDGDGPPGEVGERLRLAVAGLRAP